MAQDGTTAGGASYTLDNVTFPVGRTKLQSIFDAIRSTNIGNTAPDLVAGQFWIDNNTPSTTVWTMYLYDGTDSIQFATIDTINNTVNFIDSTFDLINDTTPQLGGTLDANGNDIDMGTNTITDTKVGQWDIAYSWGDHSTEGYITASSTDTLTNKSGNISQWTNDAGYITSETDSQTLSFSNPNLSISNGNSVDLSALSSGISNVSEDLTPQLGGDLDTNGNDINFGDNDKAVFGAGNDLQIYHDSSNSFIKDSGTGNLYIQATELRLGSATGANFISANTNDFVKLYHNNVEKLATTSTGVTVTGTVVSDGLTVDTDTLYVDSADNRVGVNNNDPKNSLHIISTSAGNFSEGLRITNADTTAGTATGIAFTNSTITDSATNTAFIKLERVSSGQNILDIITNVGSVDSSRIQFDSGEAVINEDSRDFDFRVESNNNTHALFVDGGSDVVMIGKSSTSSAVAGTTLWSGGYLNSTVASDYVARFNRTTTNGDIIQIYKDNVSVGSIGVDQGTRLFFTNSTGGGLFLSSGASLEPMNNGSRADNTVAIGGATYRFKNLYLGGGAVISEATLTDGATISWDVSTKSVAKVTLGGNRTLSAPSNALDEGQFVSLLVIQDGTGSRTLTWNAVYEFASDTAPTLTTTGGKGDLFVFRYNGTKWLEVGRNLNLSLS